LLLEEDRMPLGLILSSIGRSMRRKRTSSLNILSSKRAPRDYYKGKNCKPTGFHTRKGDCNPDLILVVLSVSSGGARF
jgi:large subunit ribosomal protein L41